ncbi:hypothetical protein L596_009580 [Steinernema carpocapsae]|uniref:Uncharacterized protein n=1 Tax=Steinernema carpocapsae TaxID=34508 RepID=A0A4V6A6M7_STECR|nr:hypothetical protein L596_009580 [Steinernema carpocapsae]
MSSSETSVHTAIDWLEDAQTAEKASERQLRYALGLASTEGITNDVSSPYRPTTLPSNISSFEDINAYFDEANMGPSFTFSTSSERATVRTDSSEYLFVNDLGLKVD